MNKNLLIAAGLIAAFAIGYILKGSGGTDLVYDYEDCISACNRNHDTIMVSISMKYDICNDAARENLVNVLDRCDELNPNKPPFMVCLNRGVSVYSEAVFKCRRMRDSLITIENQAYNSCKGDCNNILNVSKSRFF